MGISKYRYTIEFELNKKSSNLNLMESQITLTKLLKVN